MRPFGLDLRAEHLGRQFLDQDLDARLVFVVAPAIAVVDAQHGVEVGQQMLPRQELADHRADDRRAAETAADQHAETDVALVVVLRLQADVVHLDRGAVLFARR